MSSSGLLFTRLPTKGLEGLDWSQIFMQECVSTMFGSLTGSLVVCLCGAVLKVDMDNHWNFGIVLVPFPTLCFDQRGATFLNNHALLLILQSTLGLGRT